MKVKIKKLREDAVIPKYAKEGDAGLDLTATSIDIQANWIDGHNIITYGTGLSVEIPEGYVGFIYSRSSIYKKGLVMTNCVGVIDSGYRGELLAKFRQVGYDTYEVGDRVAQLVIMPYPKIELEEVDELSETERGDGGYGSSGK